MNCPKCGCNKSSEAVVWNKKLYNTCSHCTCGWTDWQQEQIAALTAERDAVIASYRQAVEDRDEFADENARLRDGLKRYEKRLFAMGAMSHAPCFKCGYNGQNYYHPDVHPCAKEHHALLKGE